MVFNEFQGVWGETTGVARGLWLSTLAVVVALSFNNFFDSLLQNIVPYQEKSLHTIGQVTMYRLLITLFLLCVLIASSIILSTSFSEYRRKSKNKRSTNEDSN